VEAQLFSEGGGNAWPQKQPLSDQKAPLTNIVDELNAIRNLQKQQYEAEQLYAQQPIQFDSYEQPSQYLDNEADDTNQLELAKIGADIQKLLKEQERAEAEELVGGQPEQPAEQPIQPVKQEKPAADQQKRGQNEFVEFVEPPHIAKALKNVEYMDKRAPASDISGPSGSNYLYYSSNNVMFIVGMTVCSVFVVAGVVGGAYHINNIRKQRNEAFDDFTRYSPAGPGRDMLRRGRGFAGSPVTELGDDSLAKAAHLHHYQQTKQKIIGSDNGIADHDQDGSDEENEDLEEHNFSIYECPGLAMSGDIEVKNPNFDAQQNP